MNRHCFLILAISAMSVLSFGQLPVRQLFVSMPDSLCPYMDMKQRVLMLEYANQKMTDSVENIYGGKSVVTNLDENYISVSISEGFTIELLTDSEGYYLIQTACAPICSSIVKRYTGNWVFLQQTVPEKVAAFMKAEVREGKIVWADQTPLLLDEEEKKHY